MSLRRDSPSRTMQDSEGCRRVREPACLQDPAVGEARRVVAETRQGVRPGGANTGTLGSES